MSRESLVQLFGLIIFLATVLVTILALGHVF
jgi:hypothetical protein